MAGIGFISSIFGALSPQSPAPPPAQPPAMIEMGDRHDTPQDHGKGLLPGPRNGSTAYGNVIKMTVPSHLKPTTALVTPPGTVDIHKTPLAEGMTGPCIKRFQAGLAQFVDVPATGTFDSQTTDAVRQFQRDNKLPVTGTVDAKTFGELWNKSFWEKNNPLELNGPEVRQSAPQHLELQAHRSQNRVDVVDSDTGKVFKSYPISAGSAAHPTPAYQDSSIKAITEKPSWHPPDSAWAKGSHPVGPGPNNPMGPVKLNISQSIYFHGVPRKEWGSIGKAPESHGCMRMYPQDVWELHTLVGSGTKVNVD